MSKTYPAIEIRFVPEAETALDLRDRLMVGLDDFSPTAIEESASAWRVFFGSPHARERALSWARAFDTRIVTQPLDVDDEDWASRSQANVEPIRAGRIVVAPPWAVERAGAERATEDEAATVIVINPSMGFGTGHHASTRLCLKLLQEVPVTGRAVLDVGTGSGVLAIAAARLGARVVVAIDNDPDAVESARENVALNPAPVTVQLSVTDFRESPPDAADIVLANLTGDVLRRAASAVARCTRPGGDCIVSGVLAEEEPAVRAAFETAGLRHIETITEDEWVGMRLTAEGPGNL